jgi:hypothetical protein
MSTPVKAARHARGWTQRHAVAQLRVAAAALGEVLPHDESVRQQLCRYEAGRATPGPFYRDLFCTIYDATPADLGWGGVLGPRDSDLGHYHHGRRLAWSEAPDVDAVTALLYALPLDAGRLQRQSRTRLMVYLRMVTDQPRCPERHTLAAGLRRARAHQPPWLDRDRLAVCERMAVSLVGQRVTDPAAEVVPDWLTGARLSAASSTAGLFTADPDAHPESA